jgi:hypothetical protein
MSKEETHPVIHTAKVHKLATIVKEEDFEAEIVDAAVTADGDVLVYD